MVDEPVIITGGSLKLKISDKFKENGTEPGKKNFKLEGQRLASLWIGKEKVRDLQPTDEVRIMTEDETTGG